MIGQAQFSSQLHSQTGQIFVEWLIVMVVSLMVAIWTASHWAQRVEQFAIEARAYQLKNIARALQQMLEVADTDPDLGRQLSERLSAGERQPIQPWLTWLTTNGWLVSTDASNPQVFNDLWLERIHVERGCEATQCPTVILLLSHPRQEQDVHMAELMLSVGGDALAVTHLNPDVLAGPTYRLPNPPGAGEKLPIGTVGLLVWRSSKHKPYVRLHESRRVQLDGGVTFGADPSLGERCSVQGLIMQGASGRLLICEGGFWASYRFGQGQYEACLPVKPLDEAFWHMLRGDGLDMWLKKTLCKCPAGYRVLEMGAGVKQFSSIELRDGFLCERL